MSQRFRGWCDQFDRQFDWHSRFFVLYLEDQLLAGLRLVLSGSYWPSARLPIELSNLSPLANCAQYRHVAEFSGLWFSGLDYGRYLCAIASGWGLWHLRDSPIYAIYEHGNLPIQRVYTRSFGLVESETAPISYPGFEYRDSSLPAFWKPCIDLPETRAQRVMNLLGLASLRRIHAQVQQKHEPWWVA